MCSFHSTPPVRDGAARTAAELDAAFGALVEGLDMLPGRSAVDRCLRWKSLLDAWETRRLASEVGADGDDSAARRKAQRGGRRSKAAARRAAQRAAAAAKNPGLLDDVESGELSTEQFDTIAAAASDDPTAATDEQFIAGVKSRSVDQGRKLARDRSNAKKDPESEHDRQMRLRRATRYKDRAKGLTVLSLEGPDSALDELWNLINQQEKALHSCDGGRDLRPGEHPRTYNQRLFDAAVSVLSGSSSLAGRPSAIITIGADGAAESVGVGPISDDVAAALLRRSSVSTQIVDNLTGQPLWLGRLSRNATATQFLALAVRDRGCVLCGAGWVRCDSHHITPWTAPLAGGTDIDNLALLCRDCHQSLHSNGQTLIRDADEVWRTRAARPDETPVKRSSGGHTVRGRPPDRRPPADRWGHPRATRTPRTERSSTGPDAPTDDPD